jgi:hypothetical protein
MNPKEVKAWMRALELAKILFEDQGYHWLYLNQIEIFIERKTMYSPKIEEELVPGLYRLALARKIPMTKLVNRIIKAYLDQAETDREENSLQDIIRKTNQ